MLQVTVPHIHQLGFNVQSHIESLLIDVGLGSKTHECNHNVLGFVLPSLILLAVLGTYMGLLLRSSGDRAAERVFVVGYFMTLADNIIFSLVIPDSYGLVSKLGGDAYLSGLVIGVFKLGTFLGAAIIFVLLRRHPKLWKEYSWHFFVICGLCSVVGTATWLVVSIFAGRSHALMSAPTLLAMLLFGRVVGGIGAGLRLIIVRTQLQCLNSARARPARQASILFAIHVGMGLGPLFAGSARLVDNAFCPALADGRYETVGLVGLAVSLACLFAGLRAPRLEGVQEFDPAVPSSAVVKEDDTVGPSSLSLGHQVVIFSCLGYSILRAFVVSGGEVATSMLLEVEYKWHVAWISMAIGACLLMCIPLNMCYARCSGMLSVKSWIQLMLGVSMVGCVLIFETPQSILVHFDLETRQLVQAFSLLFADMLILPSFWLSDALSQGVMMNHVRKDGDSFLSLNNISILQVLLIDGLTRTVGPALARGQADHTGRNGYALQQTVLTGVAVLVAVALILPRVRANGSQLVQGDEEDLKLKG